MDNKNTNRLNFKETFENFEIKPSPQLWEKITKANPQPVAKPVTRNTLLIGTAAVVVITGIILFLYYSGEQSNTDFVANIESDRITGIVDDDAVTPDPSEEGTVQDIDIQEPVESEPAEIVSSEHQPEKESGQQTHSANKDKKKTLSQGQSTTGTTIPQADMPAQISTDQTPAIKGNVLGEEIDDADTKAPVKESQTAVIPETPEEEADIDPEQKLQVFIPAAFAPNNDGVNDIFLPVIQNNAEVFDYRMQIFSRNGMLLFESTSIDIGWDGRYQGAVVDDPVSVYVISFRDIHGNPYIERGTVTIIIK